MTTTLSQFKAARRISAPIVVIKTADQFATVQAIMKSLPTDDQPPCLTWNLASGMAAMNEPGKSAFARLGVDPMTTTNPGEMLQLILALDGSSIVFCYNFHRVIDNPVVSQGVWNTRETFKTDGRTLVLLGPDMPLPAEWAQDALVIDDALPTEADLEAIIKEQHEAAELKAPKGEVLRKAIDAVTGLAAFPAEQVTAMSLTKNGIDTQALWERKRQAIEQAKGLSVYRGTETFDDIGGVENIKQFGRSILAGRAAPRAVVFIDEIEKAMAGGTGDTSGVSQEMLGTMLSWMQDKDVTGLLLVGPPGAAKSAYAKALGNTGGIPTIAFDFSGMKGSLVGESNQNLRNALKVVDAVSQGRALVVATCNSLNSLPAELKRRFRFGTFFFDLPTKEERMVIWKLYAKKYELKDSALPPDEGWTGAEIRSCCDTAWRLNVPVAEASRYIVPVSKSDPESIAKLRKMAEGRFISASSAGVYSASPATATTRQVRVSE